MKKTSFAVVALVLCFSFLLTTVEAKGLKSRQSTIIMVITGVDKVPGTDRETGFWAEEFVVPSKGRSGKPDSK